MAEATYYILQEVHEEHGRSRTLVRVGESVHLGGAFAAADVRLHSQAGLIGKGSIPDLSWSDVAPGVWLLMQDGNWTGLMVTR